MLQFTLHLDPSGTPSQNRCDLGRFDGIVEAFNTARLAALHAYTHMLTCSSPTDGCAGNLTFVDTEWGYDIRRKGLVVERFWVHDREAAVLA